MQPSKARHKTAYQMFEKIWNHSLGFQQIKKHNLETEIIKIERKSQQLLKRIVDAESPEIIKAYESRIQQLEEDKIETYKKLAHCGQPLKAFEDTFRTAMDLLARTYGL